MQSQRKTYLQPLLNSLALALVGALFVFVYSSLSHRMHELAVKSSDGQRNLDAVHAAVGGSFRALRSSRDGSSTRAASELVRVERGKPCDKAGLRKGDRIPEELLSLTERFLENRGKSVVVPVERAGRRFTVTIPVPKFELPEPDASPVLLEQLR